jgi:hypothetical protein
VYCLATFGVINLLKPCQSDAVILTKFRKPLNRRYLTDCQRYLHTKGLCFSFDINYMWTVYTNLSWNTLYTRTVFGIQCANIVTFMASVCSMDSSSMIRQSLSVEKRPTCQHSIEATQLVSWTVLLSVTPRTKRVRLRQHYIPVRSMETAAVRVIFHILIVLYWNYGIEGRDPLTYSVNTFSHVLAKYNAVPNSGASQQKYQTSSTGLTFFCEYSTI